MIFRSTFFLLRAGRQCWSRTADLPLFRITDHRARRATAVYLPAKRSAVHAARRWCTWMYETTNETELLLIGRMRC